METSGYSTTVQHGIPPKNWLIENILVTVFCCNILGIIGIIYSARVEGKFYRGDIAGAENDAKTAKTFALIALIFGGLLIAIMIVAYGTAIFTAINNGDFKKP